MNFIYVLLIIAIIVLIFGIVFFFYKRKKNNIEKPIDSNQDENIIIKEEQESFFPSIEIIENNSIVPSEKNLIKDETVKNTLAQIDNIAPKAALISNNAKTVSEVAKNGKVLFSASIEDANKMISAGGNKYYGTQVSKIKNTLTGKNKNLFTGQTKFTKETELTKKLTQQQITSAGMNVASMIVGQYYMSEINDKLEKIKEDIDNISNFQDSEYLSKIMHICSKINEITENETDIIANNNTRKNAFNDVKAIETKCAELLGQANILIDKNINDNNLNPKQYFEKTKIIDEWYKRQQITQELLLRIGDLRFTLANGNEKSCLSHKQFNNYIEITNKVNEKLKKWHNNYINKLGIDFDKNRRKGDFFEVREKTIGLINEEWNYDKVDELIVNQISSQITPKYYDKMVDDKKDKKIIIQKYKGNYYNIPIESKDNNKSEKNK